MKSLVLLSMLLSSMAYAATSTHKGEGRVKAEPDFVTVNINVTSRCYEKATEAKAANGTLVNLLKETLDRYLDSSPQSRDNYYYKPTLTKKQTESYYWQGPNGGTQKSYCVYKWRSQSVVEFKLSDLTKWSELERDLNEVLDKNSVRVDQNTGEELPGAQTWATLGYVNSDIFPETRYEKEFEALELAYNHAAAKFAHESKICGYADGTVLSSSDPTVAVSPIGYAPVGRSAGLESAGGAADMAGPELALKELWIYANRAITFEFNGNGSNCLAKAQD